MLFFHFFFTFFFQMLVYINLIYIFVMSSNKARHKKQNKMKALVKVNGFLVGIFYNMTETETKAEMQQRILNVIIKRYGNGISHVIDIIFEN